MPCSYLIDVARKIVFSRGWGALTDEELHTHAKTLIADPRFAPGFRQLADFRDLTEVLVTSDGVKILAQRNPFPPHARRAVVAPGDAAFGMSRMFETFMEADPEQFRVFRVMEPALEWVGLDPSTPWPEREPDQVFSVA